MSIAETPDDRAASIEMASALTLSVSSLHDHNDALVAENDSLRDGIHGCCIREQSTCGRERGEAGAPSRDAAMRKAELAESKSKVIAGSRRRAILMRHKRQSRTRLL